MTNHCRFDKSIIEKKVGINGKKFPENIVEGTIMRIDKGMGRETVMARTKTGERKNYCTCTGNKKIIKSRREDEYEAKKAGDLSRLWYRERIGSRGKEKNRCREFRSERRNNKPIIIGSQSYSDR